LMIFGAVIALAQSLSLQGRKTRRASSSGYARWNLRSFRPRPFGPHNSRGRQAVHLLAEGEQVRRLRDAHCARRADHARVLTAPINTPIAPATPTQATMSKRWIFAPMSCKADRLVSAPPSRPARPLCARVAGRCAEIAHRRCVYDIAAGEKEATSRLCPVQRAPSTVPLGGARFERR
jgi:hypothetical protein